MKVLVTGGAGFIGSYIVDELVQAGYDVKIYDNLEPQVHGADRKPPQYINKNAEFIEGDILDEERFYNAFKDVDILCHMAARVGIGQSMYEIKEYMGTNCLGAGIILDAVVNKKNKLKKIILASSMSIYGEGKYICEGCGPVYPGIRDTEQLKKSQWNVLCPQCSSELTPVPTDEGKPLNPLSIYAITKRDNEEAFLSIGRAYDLPVVALRYFNVYGPRQALSNPYNGICAIFSSMLLNGKRPVIFEDGIQSRDFVNVNDVARANLLAIESNKADYYAVNLGSGSSHTVLEIANTLSNKIKAGEKIEPDVKNTFREGDIRHCFSDNSKIEELLGFKPSVSFEDGMGDLAQWVAQQVCRDNSSKAIRELEKYGLA